MFGSGEGAVSTGAMVPVFDARDSGSATAVAELLESHAIPAIVDAELAGPTGLGKSERPRVFVPSTMLPAAKAILREREEQASDLSARMAWIPAKVVSTERSAPPAAQARAPGPPVSAPAPAPVEREEPVEDDLPLEVPLPEPGPLTPRLVVALIAIAFGLALQRGVEIGLGESASKLALGASAGLLEAPWRLVTAGLMHGSWQHASSNALFGLLIGVVLFGTHRVGATCLVWLLSSFVGIGAELWLSPPSTVVIGASAGNYGLVGLWAFGQLQRSRQASLPRREVLRTVGVLLLLVPGAFTPFSDNGTKVAVVAHGFGFLAGFALGVVFRRRLSREGHPRIARRSAVAGWVAVLITSGGVAWGLLDTFA